MSTGPDFIEPGPSGIRCNRTMWVRRPGLSLVIESRYGAVRRMRAVSAKTDMRRGNIRGH
jgi:hypothetical protein